MCDYFEGDDALDKLQSAYKKFHSTNTALLNITDDIYKSLDKSQITILILLDYSKAFDCANHRLILMKLKSLGFHNEALAWIYSYLLDRKQKVKTDLGTSKWVNIKNGVPQGSILGPLLFLVLVSDLHKAISNGNYHMYADDTQTYYHCKVANINSTITLINQDLARIQEFSENNCLNLNTSKSNYIIIGSAHNLKKHNSMDIDPISINNKIIERKSCVKNLGVIFDETLSWNTNVNKLIAKAYFKLKQVSRFKNFLSKKSKITICETYVLSHFNHCDSVYINMAEFLKNKIQKVQNTCLRFIFCLKKYDHVSHCLVTLNSLNMDERRLLHGLTLFHKITKKLAPVYLCNRIKRHTDFHNYNTRNRNNIVIEHNTTAIRHKSFFPTFTKLYNSLVEELDLKNKSVVTFKSKLTKHLLNKRA